MDFLDKITDAFKAGLTGEAKESVSEKNTARTYGSGGLDVYATPAMVALLEKASLLAGAPLLPEAYSTVGTMVNVTHDAASLPGALIRAKAELKEVDGRKLTFDVRAWDGDTAIGGGTHTRFIIDNEKFIAKAKAKKN
jgi:predicted thioesterase